MAVVLNELEIGRNHICMEVVAHSILMDKIKYLFAIVILPEMDVEREFRCYFCNS